MRNRAVPFSIAAIVFALDQFTKWLIKTNLPGWQTIHVIPGLFNIVHAENRGVAFGFLSNSNAPWRGLLLVGASSLVLIYVSWLLWRGRTHGNAMLTIALALILGGALGNLYDRAVHGMVTDFVEVYTGEHYFPAFNVADSAITIGGTLLVLDMLRPRNRNTGLNPDDVSQAHLHR